MSYIVIMLDRGSGSWKPIKFAKTVKTILKYVSNPGVKFERGDIFAVIEAQYVSDIENQLEYLHIAKNDRELLPSALNMYWFHLYSSKSPEYILSEMIKELGILQKKDLVFILLQMILYENSYTGENRAGVEIIREWLPKKRNSGVFLWWDAKNTNNAIGSLFSVINNTEGLTSRSFTNEWYSCLGHISNERMLSHGDYGDEIYAELVKRLIPMQAAILAVAEKKGHHSKMIFCIAAWKEIQARITCVISYFTASRGLPECN